MSLCSPPLMSMRKAAGGLLQNAGKAVANRGQQYQQFHASKPRSLGVAAFRRQPCAPVSSSPCVIAVVDEARRCFTSSASLRKKNKHAGRKGEEGDSSRSSSDASSSSSDPFDLSPLHRGIGDALARFKEDLHKLRSGGRLNPEAIENLRVHVTKGSNETVKLGELAQVVPKGGRAVTIIVGEEDLVKPVNSAIIASNLSLTPQLDPHNPLQLSVPIPPPTKESRDQSVKTAKGAMEHASTAVRNARAGLHKRLQDMQKRKEARPDDVRKAHDQMEKVVEKGQKEIKDMFESARKAFEQV